MNEKLNFRQSTFMAHDDSGEQKARENFWVKLRKTKREKKIRFKRFQNTIPPQAPPAELVSEVLFYKNIEESDILFTDICKLLPHTDHLNILLDYLSSIIVLQPHLAITLENLNLTETLISLLSHNSSTSIQSSTCLLICNCIAQTDYSRILISHNLIPSLISIINPSCLPLIENILWCFANIAGDSKSNIKTLENENLIEILVKLNLDLKSSLSDSLLKSFGFFFENITKDPSILYESSVKLIINLAHSILKDTKSLRIKRYIKALSNLAKQEEYIELIIGTDLPDIILDLVEIPKNTLPVIIFIQYIVSGTETQTIYMINKSVIKLFNTYIDSENHNITASILFSVSNVLTVPGLIDSSELDSLIIKSADFLSHPSEKVRSEASFVLKSAICKIPHPLFLRLLHYNLIESMIKLFACNNSDIIFNLLCCTAFIIDISIIHNIEGRFIEQVQQLLENVPEQVNNRNEKVSELAQTIIDKLLINQ